MKLFLYKILNKYIIFLFIKDFLINLFSKPIKLDYWNDIIIITSIIPFYKMKQRSQQLALSLSKIHKEKIIIYYEIDFWNYKFNYKKINKNLIITNSLLKIKENLQNKNILLLASWNVKIPTLFKLFWMKYKKIFYDYYDNFDWYDNYMWKYFLNTLNEYDKIICSAKLLKNQLLKKWYKNIIYLPNWVKFKDWFIKDKIKLNKIKNEFFWDDKKNIWFYWGIEHWLDYDLIKYIILKNKDKNFIFIWPDNWKFLKNNGILNFKNVKVLWYIEFKELKYYSYHFDISIIPFKLNSITDAVSPVKFFEYLSQWKPVITTWFKEILYHSEYCFISKNKEEFNKNIYIALKKSKDLNYINKIKEYSKKFEWASLAKKIF